MGDGAPFFLPTLCWFNSSDAFPAFSLRRRCDRFGLVDRRFRFRSSRCSLLFALYLSLTIAGQTFLSFQWDILLLETGFLAIFFAPCRWRMSAKREAPFSRVGLFLLKLLLFKLMFMSGVVKLTSGDDSWWNLTALDYHYWTQPLPTVLGWWAASNLRSGSEQFRTFVVLFVEMRRAVFHLGAAPVALTRVRACSSCCKS